MNKMPATPITMASVRAECAALGITPGRSIDECLKRISVALAQQGRMATVKDAFTVDEVAYVSPEAWANVGKPPKPRMSRTMRELADGTALRGPVLSGNPWLRDPYVSGDPWPSSRDRLKWEMQQSVILGAVQLGIAQWRGRQMVA